jgi:hypothetical protein
MSIAETFGQTGFAQFINSPTGRVARMVIGAGLITWGFVHRGGTAGVVLMAIGAVPLVAGLFDLCLISAVLGGPIRGARIPKCRPSA